jgi:NaMN:DMB phosphoribosyltransferase
VFWCLRIVLLKVQVVRDVTYFRLVKSFSSAVIFRVKQFKLLLDGFTVKVAALLISDKTVAFLGLV